MTAQDPLTTKLVRAHDNVARLCDFFAARRTWDLADGARPAAGELVDAARSIDERLRTLILRAGAVPLPPAGVEAEARPRGVLEVDRIRRFATYLRELDAWFAAQPGPPSISAGVIEVQRTQALVARILVLVDELTLPPAESATAARPPDAAEGPPTPRPKLDPDLPKMVVLDDTEAHPMIQEFRGVKELTPECKDAVARFLAAWKINHHPSQRKKLLDRLLRWIASAPDGQVLVLKINAASEPFEPYPAYLSRDLLATSDATDET
ncbi:MAG TPA: hypothetical protein VLT32_19540 [Candidatus Sulfomarinibacteraceae bacterium]|nr:hypothetical protein [Candidatus Sulfomarinibacteraceae bacterium]